MQCNKIQALEYPSGVPAFLFTDGMLFLDTDEEFAIRQTRRAEELNEVNKVTVSASLAGSLPYTTKNFLVLGKYINPNVHDYNFKPLKVIAYSSSNVISHSLLYVLNHDERSGRFTYELRDDDSHWAVSTKKRKLKSIQLDEFEFNRANIEATWPLAEYAAGDPGIYFPLCFYGAWKEKHSVTISDMRPWFHIKPLLIKGLAEDGWIFKSPIFDHPIGKKLIAYLLETKSLNKPAKERPNTFWAILTNEETFTAPETKTVLFDQEDYDANDVYDPSTGIFSAQGNFGFIFDLKIKNVTDAIKVRFFNEFKFRLVLRRGTQKIVIYELTGAQYARNTRLDTSTSDFIFTLDALGINIEKGLSASDQIFVEVDMPGLGEILYGGVFNNFNYGYILAENEKFYPNTFIDERLRVYDLIVAVCHLFRAKIHADPNTREFWLYPNYKVKWYDIEIDGYYLDQTYTLVPIQQIDSSQVSSQNQDTKRYLRLQFKESTDARIQGLNYPENSPPYSKTYDLGQYFENDLEIYANPLFEPTVNDKVFSIRPEIPDPNNENYIDLPMVVDNDEGNPSFEIAPRILIAHGQATYKGIGNKVVTWNWYDTIRTTIPYASQLPNLKDAAGLEIKERLTYGDHKEDLFSRFWKNWFYDNMVNTKVNILALLTPNLFHTLSFRKAYEIISNGKSVYGRLFAINDFDGCGHITTPIDIIPSTGNVKAPVLEERSNEDQCAGQNPILLVVKAGTVWTASSDTSQITDVILSTTIEWRYFDQSTWTVGNVVTDPDRPFIFRLTVELELCGNKFRTKYIIPCNNEPVIQWTNAHRDPADNTKWCITALIAGLLEDAILSSSFTKSIDGGASSAYTIGQEVCGIVNELCIVGTVQFDNDCDPIPLTACYQFPPVVLNCEDNNPTVIGTHEGNGMYTLGRGGTWASIPGPYFIEYRIPGSGQDGWLKWDEKSPVPLPSPLEARISHFWCDTCPMVCSETITLIEPGFLPGAISNELIQRIDGMTYAWDWSKLNDEEKQQMKDWYHSGNGKAIATLHAKRDMSDFDYCCGLSITDYVFRHVKKAIDDGEI